MTPPPPPFRTIDPWVTVSRIAGGVLVYGAIGYGLDAWWGTSFVVAIGVVLGAALGTYTVIRSLGDQQ